MHRKGCLNEFGIHVSLGAPYPAAFGTVPVDDIRNSSIKLVLTRHEQGAAFMAATYGRLTGKPGARCPEQTGQLDMVSTDGSACARCRSTTSPAISGHWARRCRSPTITAWRRRCAT